MWESDEVEGPSGRGRHVQVEDKVGGTDIWESLSAELVIMLQKWSFSLLECG